MADEKTGNDASNNPNTSVPQTAAPQSGDAAVPFQHPPVSNVMPHIEAAQNDPIIVPPKPPVSNVMPVTPELTLPKPVAPKVTPVQTQPQAAAPVPTPDPALAHDDIAEDVGLVRPPAKARPPDPMRADMEKILKGIKLPEKRSYVPSGEHTPTPVPPSLAAQDAKKLEDILSAQVTENPVPPGALNTPAAQPPTVPQQEVFHEALEIASVHTLKQDLQHVVKEQKMSVVKAAALEQEKRRPEPIEEIRRPPSKVPATILTIVLFLLLGLGALGSVYYIALLQSTPGPKVESSALVFAEQTVTFPLTKDSPQSLRTQIALARNSNNTLGSLMHIVPVLSSFGSDGKEVQRPATLAEFFTALGIEPPENLMRSLDSEFFLGIHTVDKNAPILVIKVLSYDRAFDGMLAWEKQMNTDLSPLFTAVPRLIMGADGLQVERPFTDLVMRNYDVRALKDDQGVIQLYYSFPTRDLLVIAESPYTFTEILSRLQAGRRL